MTGWIMRATGVSIGRHRNGSTAQRRYTPASCFHEDLEYPDALLGPPCADVSATPIERWLAVATSQELDDVQPMDSRALMIVASAAMLWVAARGALDRITAHFPSVEQTSVSLNSPLAETRLPDSLDDTS